MCVFEQIYAFKQQLMYKNLIFKCVNVIKCCSTNIILCVCVCVCVHSVAQSVQLFATPWAVARQPPLSMEFSRQEY